jgi:4a-hydroxytetrahydrobiopterin dehydratase
MAEEQAIRGQALQRLVYNLNNKWQLIAEQQLEKSFKFDNYRDALLFIETITKEAGRIVHHPITEEYEGFVKIILYTPQVNGLTGKDFLLAARIDELARTARRGMP